MILGIPHSKKHPYQEIPGTTSDEPLKFSGPSGWDDFSLTMCTKRNYGNSMVESSMEEAMATTATAEIHVDALKFHQIYQAWVVQIISQRVYHWDHSRFGRE